MAYLAWSAPRSRNFRCFLTGQALSLLAGAVQQVALGWLIYRTSRSAMVLGLAGFAGALPAALLAPFAGVLADRADPLRVILWTQGALALLAVLFALLSGAGVAALLALVCALGITNGIDRPVRQMFVARLVDRPEQIGSAVASSSMVYDGARLLGPSLGGLALAWWAEAPTFVVAALVQAAAVAALFAIRLPSRPPVAPQAGVVETLAQGVRHAFGTPRVRAVLGLSACVSFTGISYMVLLPVMAADVLKGGPHALGFLMGAVGAGAIAGGLALSFHPFPAAPTLARAGAGLYGFALLAFAGSRALALSLLALAAAGLGIMVMMTACSTLLFASADPDKHGRVLSLFAFSYLATAPLGSLWAGCLASAFGAPAAIAANAALCLLAALCFRSRP